MALHGWVDGTIKHAADIVTICVDACQPCHVHVLQHTFEHDGMVWYGLTGENC